MIHVEVYRYRNREQQSIGTITFDGTQLILDPPNDPTLLGIFSEPVRVAAGRFDPKTNPVEWLKNVHLKYRTAYLFISDWADAPTLVWPDLGPDTHRVAHAPHLSVRPVKLLGREEWKHTLDGIAIAD